MVAVKAAGGIRTARSLTVTLTLAIGLPRQPVASNSRLVRAEDQKD
jgi:deoxyribose-phosphate aldolase